MTALRKPKSTNLSEHSTSPAKTAKVLALEEHVNFVRDDLFKDELTGLMPHLRAFARSLSRNFSDAEDLVQQTMLKAWKSRARFKAGTNMKAWTFTILRNQFYSEKRRSWRRQPLDSETAEATLVSADNPVDALELLAVHNALKRLPEDQREAIILVGAGGCSYEEASEICNCATGTIKSRVSRARKALEKMLETNEISINSDANIKANDVFEDIMEQATTLADRSK